MAKEYAWSNLTTLEGKKVAPGEEVSQSDFTESDEEWQEAYLDTGAVRELPYPEEIAADESPMDYYKRRAQEISEGNFVAPLEVQRAVERGKDPEEAVRERVEADRKAQEEAKAQAEKDAAAAEKDKPAANAPAAQQGTNK